LIRTPLKKTFTLKRIDLRENEKVKINILFFDLFHAYTIRENIDYPWKTKIIGDLNVITTWQIKDDELIQSELPPTTQYQLPKVKDSNDKPVIGESIGKEKIFTKLKDKEATPSHIQIENPLFKPFKVSEKAKQKFKESRKQNFTKEEVGDSNSELLTKINNLFRTIPETPQTSEDSHKIRARQTSKLINIIEKDNDKTSDQASEDALVFEREINPINTKNWKTPSKLYYQRPTTPDILLEERGEGNFRSFSANNIYEWNIDAQTEYNIMNTLQHMSMVAMTYQTTHDCSEETIVNILVVGFSGQLKGWWDNYLTNDEKTSIYNAIKTDFDGKVIINEDKEEIPDVVNTLIFTIAQHFIGDPSLWKDRSAELLSNLKCKTLADFRWYKDTFLTRVYTREDSQQPFWKEKFLAGLPRSLGDKVRDKNRNISYDNLSYGQLISYIQKVALKICQDDKIQRQLAKEKAQNKRDLGSFYEQFGLPTCSKQKKKQQSKKEFKNNKPISRRKFPKKKYVEKPSPNKEDKMQKIPKNPKTKIVCYNCGKQGHVSKYCRLKKKIRDLNLEPIIEEQINNLFIETLEEESEKEYSSENHNQIQQDEQVFLNKLKKTLESKPRQKEFITSNKFDVCNILKRLENTSTKPTTIQDLQTEISNLKKETKVIQIEKLKEKMKMKVE
ncbi:putative Polyprotein CP, partial [Mucuna pruriens]